jgi:Protein of unknown function (DUF753)
LCDSENDENCSWVNDGVGKVECSGPCAVWIEGTNTVRGCESLKPDNASVFNACASNGCNKVIFPEERIKCVSCSGNESYCFKPDADLLKPCKNYVEDDLCYTYVIGN